MDRDSFKKLFFSPPFNSQIPNPHIFCTLFSSACSLQYYLDEFSWDSRMGRKKASLNLYAIWHEWDFMDFRFLVFLPTDIWKESDWSRAKWKKNLQNREKNIVGRKRFCHPLPGCALVHGIQNGLSSHNNTCLWDIWQNRRIYTNIWVGSSWI